MRSIIIINKDACHALGSLPSLRKLYLTGTPLNSALKFKQYITLACEGLEVLNNKEITVREREFLVKMHMANAKRKCQPNTSTSSISISSSITTRNTEQQAMFLSSATSPTSIEVLPHMPPYASQYRDLILQQTAVQQNRTNVLMKMSSVPRIELEFGSPTHTSKSSRQTTTTLARAAEK